MLNAASHPDAIIFVTTTTSSSSSLFYSFNNPTNIFLSNYNKTLPISLHFPPYLLCMFVEPSLQSHVRFISFSFSFLPHGFCFLIQSCSGYLMNLDIKVIRFGN
ncbi:hypothetical protein QVD17_09437 [Tagetes erecta]|uniref:Uncharacterized protein n=1 Tax=Tagetes erecta TaxID=13708 RepID=A0AAD8NYG9_TARER|nr:hypothetical protein QVD17_09437 [Tagetes erecta]